MIVVSGMISIFCPLVFVRIASSGTPPPFIREYCPAGNIMVEEVLLTVCEQEGHDKPSFASRMNKAVVVFLKRSLLFII